MTVALCPSLEGGSLACCWCQAHPVPAANVDTRCATVKQPIPLPNGAPSPRCGRDPAPQKRGTHITIAVVVCTGLTGREAERHRGDGGRAARRCRCCWLGLTRCFATRTTDLFRPLPRRLEPAAHRCAQLRGTRVGSLWWCHHSGCLTAAGGAQPQRRLQPTRTLQSPLRRHRPPAFDVPRMVRAPKGLWRLGPTAAGVNNTGRAQCV